MRLTRLAEGPAWQSAVILIGSLALIAAAGFLIFPRATALQGAYSLPSTPEPLGSARVGGFEVDRLIECAVIALQIMGLASLCIARLSPSARWVVRAWVVFAGAVVGLGLTALLCAFHNSHFVFYAGGSSVVLLALMMLGADFNHAPEPNRDPARSMSLHT